MIKTFVVDTNVLLHNPNALFLFAENEVIIPFDVIEELDKFKSGTDDLGRNARSAIRHLDQLRQQGNLADGVPIPQTGGSVRVVLEEDQKLCPGLTANTPDNRIICCALTLKQDGRHVVFISKDINARIKGDAMGLIAEDFEAQKVDFDHLYTGWREVKVTGKTIDRLFADKALTPSSLELTSELFANEFVLLRDESDEAHTALTRYKAEPQALVPVRPRKGPVFGILPRNLQQTMAFDLLLDDSVRLVSLIGAAGTGKTLMAVAAGMVKTLNDGLYQKLLCARPIMPLGRDIGYLPGTKDEKLSLWMQPIFDNLAHLLSTRGTHLNEAESRSTEQRIETLLEGGKLVIEPLTYIRGRSIPNQFMIVDEVQNLSPHEVKTIVSRVGDGTKIILTGDINQIDNPYLDASSNGLSYVIEHMKSQRLAGHVTLKKSERSELASLAADLL
jgi:PhoH-like ATPase